jgi:hypothetical protein
LVKIDIAKNQTEGKVLGNYEKKLEIYSNTEYLVKYFATIFSFLLVENLMNFSGGKAKKNFSAQTQTSISL